MKFYIVDAFADKIFGGNPAGVVLVEDGEYPSFDIMKKTAAELGFSETAFIKNIKSHESGIDSYELRYITPTDEVDLCGHATIASFSIIGNIHSLSECEHTDYIASTKAGEINIRVSKDLVMMDMAKPEIINELSDRLMVDRISGMLGLSQNSNKLSPAIVSTGLPDIIFPVSSVDELNSIEPDFPQLTRLSEELNVVGIHAFVLNPNSDKEKEPIAYCRNFAPLYGIPEEAATGTANGALTYYLRSLGLIEDDTLNTIEQGAAMGRPSTITTIVHTDDNGNKIIKVGGSAITLSQGEIFI